MKKLSADALRRRFVEVATARFAKNVPDFARLQALIDERGGRFLNDHGAIRVADPALTEIFVRGAKQFGLHRDLNYSFPAKKLESFDLQVPGDDPHQFKIFVSELDRSAFSATALAAIDDDCQLTAEARSLDALIGHLDKAERDGGVSDADGEALVQLFVSEVMSRPAPPIKRSCLNAVAAESGEAASALALGPDFNHVTIDVRAAGFEGIDAMAAAMQAAGFRMLPAIQGAPGTKLRQTATLAATMDTPVVEADGSVGNAQTEKQFVEIIERAPERKGGRVFKNFLAANAEKIFDAASTKSVSGSSSLA